MLFRLELQGVEPGNRWVEIADKAEQRIGDCLSPFTLPHWMMALAATGREQTARLMLAGMRAYAEGLNANASVVKEVALPVAEAVLAHRRGEYSAALDRMRPLIAQTQRMGGSHAQHDVLRQLFLDCAVRAEKSDDIRLILALAGRYPAPVERRVGYAEVARRLVQ
jgi:hypothetical protein